MKNTRLLIVTALVAVLFNVAKAEATGGPGAPKVDAHATVKGPSMAPANIAKLLDAQPGKILRAEDVLAGKIEWVEGDAQQLKELNGRIEQLRQLAQGLVAQRDALAKQALDAQLQVQQLQDQIARMQPPAAPAPPK